MRSGSRNVIARLRRSTAAAEGDASRRTARAGSGSGSRPSAEGAGGRACPPRSRALDLPEGCGRVRCSSCRQSAGRTCRNPSCLGGGDWRVMHIPPRPAVHSSARHITCITSGLEEAPEMAARRGRAGADAADRHHRTIRRRQRRDMHRDGDPGVNAPRNTARPLDVPTRERPAAICSRIRLFFDCSSIGALADRRPASVAGSVVTRHPAGGATRRRSMVSMSGGPFSC